MVNRAPIFTISFWGGVRHSSPQAPPGRCPGAAFPDGVFLSSRYYSAPGSVVSAGLRKAAAEEQSDEDSYDDEKPGKQEEIPKEFVPKKLKTVSSPGNFVSYVTNVFVKL